MSAIGWDRLVNMSAKKKSLKRTSPNGAITIL